MEGHRKGGKEGERKGEKDENIEVKGHERTGK